MTRLGDMLARRVKARRDEPPEPAPSLADTLKRRKRSVGEMARILSLPVRDYSGREAPAEWTLPGALFELRPVQVAALLAIKDAGGGFLPIGVGWGKSWIACLAATALDRRLAIIVAPAGTIKQLRDTYRILCDHFNVRPARFISYGRISTRDGSQALANLLGDTPPSDAVLVLDEAHKVRNLNSARTRRVVRFSQMHPEVAVVAMSGTLTSRKVEDMGHLAEMALREQTPLPRVSAELQRWGLCLNEDGRACRRDWEWLSRLDDFAQTGFPTMRGDARQRAAREAFRKRLHTAPGVVATSDASVSCSLYLCEHERLETPPEVVELLTNVGQGIHPRGEVIVEDLEAYRTRLQLVSGFWYRWVWPNDEPDEQWLDARRQWGRYVRNELQRNAQEGYDSPSLVFDAIRREHEEGRRRAIHLAWSAWNAVRGRKPPPTEPVWVSDYLVDYAVEWLEHNEGILWYSQNAVADRLEEAGVKVYRAGQEPERHRHRCAMSIRSHGTGLNLQAWDRALIVEPPSSGSAWEQLLGRLHRQGQKSDEVCWEVMAHCTTLTDVLRSARSQAAYIQQTTGQRQKLLFASSFEMELFEK